MSRSKSLTKIKLIKDILVTVAICDQCGVTRTIGQAHRPWAHGNARYRKLAKVEAISRNWGSF